MSQKLFIVLAFVIALVPFSAARAQSGNASELSRRMQIEATVNPALVTTGGTALQVLGTTLPSATVGAGYTALVSASGGTPPYSWQVLAGSVPVGLDFTGDGKISGTPTSADTAAFAAQVTDAKGSFSAGTFTLPVKSAPVSVVSVTPPTGIVGVPYPTQVISASGGLPFPPVSLTEAGNLPPGLTFSGGEISGIPTSAGSYNYTVTATDTTGASGSQSFTIVIQPAHTDLVLHQASAPFAIAAGTASVPADFKIPVVSSDATKTLNFSVSVPSGNSWLNVTASGTQTPGVIDIGLTSAALALPSGTNLSAAITVSCVAPSSCAGNSQTIQVTLAVNAPAPELSLSTGLLSYTVAPGASVSQALGIQNIGGGAITVNSIYGNADWISVSGIPATLPPGPPAEVIVTVTPPSVLGPGFYQRSVIVNTSAGQLVVPVDVLITSLPSVSLSPAGSQVYSITGTFPGNLNGSFEVSVSGSGSVNWSAALTPPLPWISLAQTSGSATAANPGKVSYTLNSPAIAGASPGTYYATVRVTTTDVADPVLDYQIVLNVLPPGSVSTIDVEPQGLIFTAAGGSAPQSQTLEVFTDASVIPYLQVADSPWLSVAPGPGGQITSYLVAGQSTVTVTPGTLQPGVYRGHILYAASASALESINVTLIVTPSAAKPSNRVTISSSTPACKPSQIVPAQLGPADNFVQPTSWPTPLTIQLLDDCGSPITNGQVITTFSNGDQPLVLSPVGSASGIYSGTWSPSGSAQNMTITSRATASGFAAATIQSTGEAVPNPAPSLSPNGAVNVFGAPSGSPLAPGEIISIYGNFIGPQTPAFFSAIPLTTSLGNTSVIIGGIPAPLYYAGPNQINAQVPFELKAGAPYQIVVNANNALSAPETVQISQDGPGVVTYGAGYLTTEHSNGVLVSESAPAAPGEYITAYTTGMGLTVATVASGQPSPDSPLPTALDQPVVMLNGQTVPTAPYSYAGLSPTYVGLDQVTFQVPADAPNGDLQLVIVQSGGQTNPAILPVHN